ncbi:hypothetical protein ACLIJR_16550 [Hydrogenophaga sp. XSHU_21]
MSLSIERLASEGVNRIDGALSYRSAVTLTGISPPISTGRLLSVPGDGLPEQLSVPISTGCSKIVETIYETDATLSDVRSIAASLELLRDRLTTKAEKEVLAQIARTAKSVAQSINDGAQVSTEQATALKNALGVEDLSVASVSQLENKLNSEIDILAVESAKITTDLISLKNKVNIFIFRWERMDAAQGGGAISDLFTTRATQKDARQGYLIAAGLRIAALEFGDDLMLKLARDVKQDRTGSDAVLQNNFITNYTVGAKYTYFSEDRDSASAIALALQASTDDVQKLLGGSARQILEAKSIAIDAAISASVASGARGLVTEPTRKTYPFRMWGDLAFNASGEAERVRNEKFNVFYSTRSNIVELRASPSSVPEDRAQLYCMQMVPASGKISESKHYEVGTKFCMPKGRQQFSRLANLNPADWEPDTNACLDFAVADGSHGK